MAKNKKEHKISLWDLEGSIENVIAFLSNYSPKSRIEIRTETVRSSHIDGGPEEETQLWVVEE